MSELSQLLQEALTEYNDVNPVMDLVLFEDAMRHICRITRIINNNAGHALLVGVGGSGKQSLSRLSAFISSCTPFQITISSKYDVKDLKNDIRVSRRTKEKEEHAASPLSLSLLGFSKQTLFCSCPDEIDIYNYIYLERYRSTYDCIYTQKSKYINI